MTGHEILSYLPGEMLSTRVTRTPPGFSFAELTGALWSVFLFQDVGEGETRISASGVGYLDSEGWDTIYDFFEQGNAMMLEQLSRRLRDGPVDWSEALEAMTRHQEAGAPAPEEQ